MQRRTPSASSKSQKPKRTGLPSDGFVRCQLRSEGTGAGLDQRCWQAVGGGGEVTGRRKGERRLAVPVSCEGEPLDWSAEFKHFAHDIVVEDGGDLADVQLRALLRLDRRRRRQCRAAQRTMGHPLQQGTASWTIMSTDERQDAAQATASR